LNAGSNASKHRTSFRMSSRTARMISGNDTTDAHSMCALQGERHTCIDKRRPGESFAYNRAWRAWLVRRRAALPGEIMKLSLLAWSAVIAVGAAIAADAPDTAGGTFESKAVPL